MILRSVLAAALVLSTIPAAVPSVASADVKMRTICEGFRPLSGTPTYLRGLDFYEGPVADNATLAPDKSEEADGKLTNTWTFQPGAKITLVCNYGGSKQVRSLSKTVTVCTATFVASGDSRKWKPANVSCG